MGPWVCDGPCGTTYSIVLGGGGSSDVVPWLWGPLASLDIKHQLFELSEGRDLRLFMGVGLAKGWWRGFWWRGGLTRLKGGCPSMPGHVVPHKLLHFLFEPLREGTFGHGPHRRWICVDVFRRVRGVVLAVGGGVDLSPIAFLYHASYFYSRVSRGAIVACLTESEKKEVHCYYFARFILYVHSQLIARCFTSAYVIQMNSFPSMN